MFVEEDREGVGLEFWAIFSVAGGGRSGVMDVTGVVNELAAAATEKPLREPRNTSKML